MKTGFKYPFKTGQRFSNNIIQIKKKVDWNELESVKTIGRHSVMYSVLLRIKHMEQEYA